MKRIILAAVLIIGAAAALAQESDLYTYRKVQVPLTGEVKNLSVVDSALYCNSSNVLLGAIYRNGNIINLDAALSILGVDPKLDYAVRHPQTGDLYYTVVNKKGVSQLYEYSITGKKPVSKMVKLGKSGMSIVHPVFSTDGNILVFSSPDGLGFGGTDLWYSRLGADGWDEPRNFGHWVNTPFDENAPWIYGDYLVFASNGRNRVPSDSVAGNSRLYVTRLIATRQLGDTIMMLPIGRAPVQSLPYPFNCSGTQSLEMVVDMNSKLGYWLSLNSDKQELWEMQGTLSGALVEGYITDADASPISNVLVTARDENNTFTITTTTTDVNGYYSMMLNTEGTYTIVAAGSGYFESVSKVASGRNTSNQDLLIVDHRVDMTLETMLLGKAYELGDLFGPKADVDLSETGEAVLTKMAAYLCDNDRLKAQWTVWSDFRNDQFGQLVTEQRLLTIQKFLKAHGVSSNRLQLINGDQQFRQEADAAGHARCAVVLNQ